MDRQEPSARWPGRQGRIALSWRVAFLVARRRPAVEYARDGPGVEVVTIDPERDTGLIDKATNLSENDWLFRKPYDSVAHCVLRTYNVVRITCGSCLAGRPRSTEPQASLSPSIHPNGCARAVTAGPGRGVCLSARSTMSTVVQSQTKGQNNQTDNARNNTSKVEFA